MIAGKRIHVVEDDPLVRQTLIDSLERAGAIVRASESGAELLKSAHDDPPDMALIDLRLSQADGLSLLTELRRISDVPVIIITGKGDEFDEVMGLESGADDFVRKPFAMRVLMAHMTSVLRRYENLTNWDMNHLSGFLAQRNWQIDDRSRELLGANQQSIPLTATEVRMLNILAERAGSIMDRPTLYARVFHRELTDQSRTIDVLISRLRRKLQENTEPGSEFLVQGVYGKGYRLIWADQDDQ